MKTNTNTNENTMNETIYDWWQRSYNDESNTCFNHRCCNYFKNDVKSNTGVTFAKLLEAMKSPDADVYALCDIGDSEVRMVIFRRLCELYDLSYETIYRLWLDGIEGLHKYYPIWKRLANYRGKNADRLQKRTRKEAKIAFDDDATVEYIKSYFAKVVDDCEKLSA